MYPCNDPSCKNDSHKTPNFHNKNGNRLQSSRVSKVTSFMYPCNDPSCRNDSHKTPNFHNKNENRLPKSSASKATSSSMYPCNDPSCSNDSHKTPNFHNKNGSLLQSSSANRSNSDIDSGYSDSDDDNVPPLPDNPIIRGTGRIRAVECKSICDHENRSSPRQSLPCYLQHERRTRTARGCGEINDPEVRNKVLAMFKGRCIMGLKYNNKCVNKLTLSTLEVDHVYPFSRGGYDGLKNWAPICRSCNAKKNYYHMGQECTRTGNNGRVSWLCNAKESAMTDKGKTNYGFGKYVVCKLTDTAVHELLSKHQNKQFRIMVFTDWCGLCLEEKPLFSDLAERDNQYTYVAVKGSDKCSRYESKFQVKHYPYYVQYHRGNVKSVSHLANWEINK
eukprot:Awhi_evm2s2232